MTSHRPRARRRLVLVLAGLGAGGAERVASLLTRHWADQGACVTVLAFVPPGTRPYYAFDSRIALQRLGLPSEMRGATAGLAQALSRVLTLRQALRAIEPDAVVSFLTKINVLTLLATRGLGCPVLVSERNNPNRQDGNRLWRQLSRALGGLATRHVMQTEASLASLPARARRRAVVVPNPVPLPARTIDPATAPPRLVAVGRLVPQKGFDLLLEAFARTAPRHPAWSLTIWGEGPERGRLERRAGALGLEGRVRLPGLTAAPGGWIEDAGAFVLASRYEGFPNALAEAMAAGLPVVASDCPWGPRELIRPERDGLLVPAEDPAALAAALDRIMGDPSLRARLGGAAQASVAPFAVERVMARWDAVLQESLAGRPPRGSRRPPARLQGSEPPGQAEPC